MFEGRVEAWTLSQQESVFAKYQTVAAESALRLFEMGCTERELLKLYSAQTIARMRELRVQPIDGTEYEMV